MFSFPTKYLRLFSISWQNALVYRTSLLLWRLRQIFNTLLAITLWGAVYQTNSSVIGYTSDQMFTYIFLSAIMQNIIMATALHRLPGMVYSGELSLWLVRPVRPFLTFLTTDLADKALNATCIILETAVFYLLLRPVLTVPDLGTIFIFLIWLVLGIGIHFFVELLFGALGFWSPDVWGPKFLFFMITENN